MNTECAICYETKIMTPCMALNNCKAMVCKECKRKMPIEYGDMFNPKCMFCFTNEYYRDVITELDCDIFNEPNCDTSDKYVLLKYQMKHIVIDEEFYADYDYCYDCEEI